MGWLQDLLSEVPLSAVLRERVRLAEERYERALQDIETHKTRIKELESENEALRTTRALPKPSGGDLDEVTTRVLVHLFKTDKSEQRDVGIVAAVLDLERSVLMYHLERLDDAGLAENTGFNTMSGAVYWALTSEGRRYVVERGLTK